MKTSDRNIALLREILLALKSIDYTLRFGKKRRKTMPRGYQIPK